MCVLMLGCLGMYLGSITAALKKFNTTKQASNSHDNGDTSPNSIMKGDGDEEGG